LNLNGGFKVANPLQSSAPMIVPRNEVLSSVIRTVKLEQLPLIPGWELITSPFADKLNVAGFRKPPSHS